MGVTELLNQAISLWPISNGRASGAVESFYRLAELSETYLFAMQKQVYFVRSYKMRILPITIIQTFIKK